MLPEIYKPYSVILFLFFISFSNIRTTDGNHLANNRNVDQSPCVFRLSSHVYVGFGISTTSSSSPEPRGSSRRTIRAPTASSEAQPLPPDTHGGSAADADRLQIRTMRDAESGDGTNE